MFARIRAALPATLGAVSWGAAVLLSNQVASAASPEDSARAESLFLQGRQLLTDKKFDAACAAFAESQRLDPASGTLLNLANCYEQQGKLASAWATFTEARASAHADHREDRARIAEQRAQALSPRVPRLQLDASAVLGLPGIKISLDGQELGTSTVSLPTPLDPGEHRVRAEAPGYQPVEETVQATEGHTESLVLPALAEASTPPQPSTAPTATPTAGRDVTADQGSSKSHPSMTVWVLGGASLVALGAGSYFGLRAIGEMSDSDAACKGGCTERGASLSHDAVRDANLSNLGFGLGLVGAAVTGYLWWKEGQVSHGPASGGASTTRESVAASMQLVPTRGGAFLGYSSGF